jgi:tetratricopeptide (TPR) repeat protein
MTASPDSAVASPQRRIRRIWRMLLSSGLILSGIAVLLFAFRDRLQEQWTLRSARHLLHISNLESAAMAKSRLNALVQKHQHVSAETHYLLGRAQRRMGEIERALESLKRAESAGWDAAQIQLQRQLALIQRGHIDQQTAAFDRLLLQNSPDDIAYEIYEAMSRGYMFSYRFQDALHCLNFWTDWCRTAIDPRLWRATLWEQIEQWDQAIVEYREVMRLDATNLTSRQSLARILLTQKNKPDEAYSVLQDCLSLDVDNVLTQIGLASCERHLARPEDSERRLRALLKQSLSATERTSVNQELGQVLLDRREVSEAIPLLKSVVEADPLNSAAHYSLGTAYSWQSADDLAARHLEQSRQLTEQFARLTQITAELVNHPENADLRWEAGQILMDRGLHIEGAGWMATALIYQPDHQKTHASLATYYETVRPDAELAKKHRARMQANPP